MIDMGVRKEVASKSLAEVIKVDVGVTTNRGKMRYYC